MSLLFADQQNTDDLAACWRGVPIAAGSAVLDGPLLSGALAPDVGGDQERLEDLHEPLPLQPSQDE